jgi:hypothetical protein
MRTHHAQSPARSGSQDEYSPKSHREMVAVAAYYRAERRGSGEGGELDDWFEAEAEVDRQPHSEPGDEAKDGSKLAYQRTLEAKLKKWDAKLERLKAKAQATSAEIRDDFELQLEYLAGERALAQEKLQELRQHGEWAWEDLKDSANQVWSDLREALERSASRFK